MDLGAPAARPGLEDVGVVEQSTEERGDGRRVAEELAPVVDGSVRGQERRGTLVAPQAVSFGGRDEPAEHLGWFCPLQCLSRAVIELSGCNIEMGFGVAALVGARREGLTK